MSDKLPAGVPSTPVETSEPTGVRTNAQGQKSEDGKYVTDYRTCVGCGEFFAPITSDAANRQAYCSPECEAGGKE